MAILDSKGRLFGLVSLIDLGAGLIILMAIAGLALLPGGGGSLAQGGELRPVEVDVIVQGLTVTNPKTFTDELTASKKTSVIIRNQPYGEVNVLSVKNYPRSVTVPQPDGSVKSMPDPRPELQYKVDAIITLGGDARVVDNGPVFGNVKVKVGTPLEIEGQTYRVSAPVIGVRILEKQK
jgi:Domain of unknown function (DUF4330)